ncbi:MAG TPA: hypothetical protein VKR79_09690 [Gaiellaceae bacterium]|nr:hypothetical protein [Gaiellaceae bacterium]
MSSTERSVVLGAHTGLPTRLIEPFARSLRATGFNGTFVVFAGLCGAEEKDRLRGLADVVVDVDPDYPRPSAALLRYLGFLRSTRRVRRVYPAAFRLFSSSRLEYHLEGLQSLRYSHYQRYLAELTPAPDAVLLTDLRDVAFQRDPFEGPVEGLEVYLEDPSVQIGSDPFNTRWIRNLYGRGELERLRGRTASCSGTVVGTGSSVLAYLDEMTKEIARHRRPLGSHDQGIHNGLLQHGRLPFATVVPNGIGRVLTLGKMSSYATSPDGTVLNADGTVPAILHQWDRHAELVERVEAVR